MGQNPRLLQSGRTPPETYRRLWKTLAQGKPLSFLDHGRRYTAQVYRDGADADYRGKREDIVIEQREVTAGDTLRLRLAPGGGQAIRFVAH